MKLFIKILLVLGFSALLFESVQTHAFAVVDEGPAVDGEVVITETPVDTTVYTIFVHEDCSHCAAVEAFVKNYKIEDRINFLQLKDNSTNMSKLEQYWEEFNIEGGVAWPMMVVDEGAKSYELGSTPIMGKLAELLELDYEAPADSDLGTDGVTENDNTGDKIFFAIGGFFIVAVLGYTVYSVMKSE